MTLVGTDYKLTLSFVRRYQERLHWPDRTPTGWCFGAFGIHYKVRVIPLFGGYVTQHEAQASA